MVRLIRKYRTLLMIPIWTMPVVALLLWSYGLQHQRSPHHDLHEPVKVGHILLKQSWRDQAPWLIDYCYLHVKQSPANKLAYEYIMSMFHTVWQKPSIIPWITISHRINLWCLSRCQSALGHLTWYWQRHFICWLRRTRPTQSILHNDSTTQRCCTHSLLS